MKRAKMILVGLMLAISAFRVPAVLAADTVVQAPVTLVSGSLVFTISTSYIQLNEGLPAIPLADVAKAMGGALSVVALSREDIRYRITFPQVRLTVGKTSPANGFYTLPPTVQLINRKRYICEVYDPSFDPVINFCLSKQCVNLNNDPNGTPLIPLQDMTNALGAGLNQTLTGIVLTVGKPEVVYTLEVR